MSQKVENEELELIRGSGNVFRDFGHPNAEIEYLRAVLAAEIVKTLDARSLSTRAAEAATGTPAADFSRIRQAKLDRFSIERLMGILARLDRKVEISISVHPQAA